MNARTALALCERHVRHRDVDYVPEYGEPGYDSPKAGILFADWNDAPQWLLDGLERRGFDLEWSDEWLLSHETGKAYRCSPNSYSWTPYYVLTEDGDVYGGDEIENGDQAEWYVNEYLLNNPGRCNMFCGLKLADHGFVQYDPASAPQSYETGWHPGQNDNPADVFKQAQAQYPGHDIVFQLDGKGQFDTEWSAWIRPRQAS